MTGEKLSEQRKRLEALEHHEGELARLRDRENDLEVECIAAKAALGAAAAHAPAGIDAATATTIGLALAHRQMLADGLEGVERRLAGYSGKSDERRRRLESGREALAMWLEKPARSAPDALQRGARVFLLVVTVAAVIAAIRVHPAFLLIVVVVSGPVSFLLWRGQDNEWRRLGARRRFDATGLAPIRSWTDEHVSARLRELEAALAEESVAPADVPSETYAALEQEKRTLSSQLAEADAHAREALAGAGLAPDDLDPELSRWLELHARAERARLELEQVQARRRSTRGDADEMRDGLYRYLSRRGEAPSDGRADTGAIAERIERLADRGEDADD